MAKRSRVGLVLAAALCLVLAPTAVAAARPQPIAIESPMTVTLPGTPNTGTFTASGSDRICASGTVVDTRYVWDLPDHLLVDKTFDCGDGLIRLRLQVHYSGADETFTWTILGATDAYAGLHGHGIGTTTPTASGAINHYTGFLVG
jgi:hypothetical protein